MQTRYCVRQVFLWSKKDKKVITLKIKIKKLVNNNIYKDLRSSGKITD